MLDQIVSDQRQVLTGSVERWEEIRSTARLLRFTGNARGVVSADYISSISFSLRSANSFTRCTKTSVS